MRKLVCALSSAAVTFMFGVMVTSVWSNLFPRQVLVLKIPRYTHKVSLCTLAHNPAAYDKQLIRVEALGSVIPSSVFGDYSFIILEPGCSKNDAWASVLLDSSSTLSPELAELINSPRREQTNARFLVEGQFDPYATPGCFAPRFAIRNARVKFLSPVTSEPLPERPSDSSR